MATYECTTCNSIITNSSDNKQITIKRSPGNSGCQECRKYIASLKPVG